MPQPRDHITLHHNAPILTLGRDAMPKGDRPRNDANVTSYARGMWDSGARTYEGRTGSY